MTARLTSLVFLAILLVPFAPAKDKNQKKPILPDCVLQARTVLVVIEPDAGEPLDELGANATARDNVERSLLEWGRFSLVMDGQDSDLIIAVRTGNGNTMRPTIKGGPIDQRPGIGQSTDTTIRIGAQRGQPPPLTDPTMEPPNQGPRIDNEAGLAEDSFAVYRGGVDNPLDSSPLWRYVEKDSLRAPGVTAVQKFRKLIADEEKLRQQSKKKP